MKWWDIYIFLQLSLHRLCNIHSLYFFGGNLLIFFKKYIYSGATYIIQSAHISNDQNLCFLYFGRLWWISKHDLLLPVVPVIHLHNFIFPSMWLGIGFVDRNRVKNIGKRYNFMQYYSDGRSFKKVFNYTRITWAVMSVFSFCCFLKSRALENVMCIM